MVFELLQAGHQPVLQNTNLQKVATFAAIGAGYSVVGWLNSRAKRGASAEPFRVRKAAQTVIIGIVAGAVVASRGQAATIGNLDAAMTVAIPVANQIVNMAFQAARNTDDNQHKPSID